MREAGEALASEDEDHDRDSGRQSGGEGERFEHADALAEPRHERDLDRAGQPGGHRKHRRNRAPGHGRQRYSPSWSAPDLREVLLQVARVGRQPLPGRRLSGHRLVAGELGVEHALAAGQARELAP